MNDNQIEIDKLHFVIGELEMQSSFHNACLERSKEKVVTLKAKIESLKEKPKVPRYELRFWDHKNGSFSVRSTKADLNFKTILDAMKIANESIERGWRRVEIFDTQANRLILNYDGTMNNE